MVFSTYRAKVKEFYATVSTIATSAKNMLAYEYRFKFSLNFTFEIIAINMRLAELVITV